MAEPLAVGAGEGVCAREESTDPIWLFWSAFAVLVTGRASSSKVPVFHLWRRKERIKRDSERVIKQPGDELFEHRAREFEARITVHLDECWVEVCVYHEIVS